MVKKKCGFNDICDLSDNCPKSGCGLKSFLTKIKQEKKAFNDDIQLIEDLEREYLTAWNSNVNSKARGVSTGTAFENWVIKQLSRNHKVEKGAQEFKFGTLNVDAIITTEENGKVFLEMKIGSDRQHALMFAGLINQRKENEKIGYIPFYTPNHDVLKILNSWIQQHPSVFNFFPIENSWSKALRDLNNFIQ